MFIYYSNRVCVEVISNSKFEEKHIICRCPFCQRVSMQLFLQVLPLDFDILCTHPMFGPENGKAGLSGLPFVYEKVRVGKGVRAEHCYTFFNIFTKEGCRMVEMTCAEHDRHAVESQFITHTVGRMLAKLNLESTPINTKGYETLL
jgi:arogenate dehydrogenase (NADP+)